MNSKLWFILLGLALVVCSVEGATWSPGEEETAGGVDADDNPNSNAPSTKGIPQPPADKEFAPQEAPASSGNSNGNPSTGTSGTSSTSSSSSSSNGIDTNAEPEAAEAAANKEAAEATGETAGTTDASSSAAASSDAGSSASGSSDASVTVEKKHPDADKFEVSFGCSLCTTYAKLYAPFKKEKEQYDACAKFSKIEQAKRSCQAFFWRHGKLLEQEKPGGVYHACYVAGFCHKKGALGLYLGYNYSAAVLEDKPTHYLRLNDPPLSKTIRDASKYRHNGGIHGGTQKFGSPGLIANDFNSAVEVNVDTGDKGFMYVPDNDVFGAKTKTDGKFTAEVWIRPYKIPNSNTNGDLAVILDKLHVEQRGDKIEHVGFRLCIEKGIIKFSIADFVTTSTAVAVDYPTVQSGPVHLYQKYHIVAAFDGVNLRLFVNGVQFKKVIAIKAAAGNKFWNKNKEFRAVPSPSPLKIGAATVGHQLFKGIIDEIAFYNNTALKKERVDNHHKWGYGEAPPAGKTPVVSKVTSNPSGTTGGTMVTITGSNFYPQMKVTIGGKECTRASWMSATKLACVAPAGAGKDLPVVVEATGGKKSKPVNAFTYANPIVNKVVPDFGPGNGGNTVVIEGENFGAKATAVTAKFGPRAATGCKWKSQNAVECKVPPGTDLKTKVSVTVSGMSSQNWGLYNYDVPSCLYAFNTRAHRGSGDYTIDPDGKTGPSQPVVVRCDMTGDGGGWTLASHYHFAEKKFVVTPKKLAGHISAHIDKLESRYEVHTTKRVYKRFLKNTGVRGVDHYGNRAWAAQCKQKWSDKWEGNDWGLNKALSFTFVPLHKAASNKGAKQWRYNVMSQCHRSLTNEKDNNRYTAQANTYYKGWNAYCGGLRTSPNVVQAAGCATTTTFENVGGEGKKDGTYISDINDRKHIMVWIK